jgi:hypothetical protein
MKKYYGQMPQVDRHITKFRNREIDLMRAGISSRHYAYVVAIMWKRWARQHGHDYLPVHVFLCDRSLEWYKDLMEKATVRLDVPDSMLEYAEMRLLEQAFAVGYLTSLTAADVPVTKGTYITTFADEYGDDGKYWLDNRTPELEREVVEYLSRFGKFKTRTDCETYDELYASYQGKGRKGVDWLSG